jgi:hypothetical protein
VSLKQGHPQDGVLLLPAVSDRGHDGPNPVVVTCHGPDAVPPFVPCLLAAYLSFHHLVKIRLIGLLSTHPPDLAGETAAIHQKRSVRSDPSDQIERQTDKEVRIEAAQRAR